MFLEPKGRDWGWVVNWDDLGKAYAIFIVTWTAILLVGIAWLIYNRRLAFIKIRNVPLAISSTFFLHLYLIKICLAYTTNGHFTCSAEYWIMSIYLPLGIALYQAYLVQLRSVYEQQVKLVSSDAESLRSRKGASIIQRVQALSSLHQSYCIIGLGLIIQLVITAVLYATTPTLQGDWSSYGNVSHAAGQGLCRKSLPWIPSAFWQLFLSWFYGPYILFKARKIQDIHFWKAQVIISVISGLPGSPLWLAALYSVKFKPINKRFIPPMWLAPGIIVIQFVTIFFPIFEYWVRRRELRDTMSLLRAWDEHSQASDKSLLSKSSPKISIDSQPTPAPDPETRMNTMDGLRKCLAVNPEPLLHFAATRDFTAENILFLTRVRQWRAAWLSIAKTDDEFSSTAYTNLFNAAVNIYTSLVDDRTADFPINIPSTIRTKLDDVFASATPALEHLSHKSSFETQFGTPKSDTSDGVALTRMDSSDFGGSTLWDKQASHMEIEPAFQAHPAVEPLQGVRGVIREGFGEHVFDDAEKSIEYLVLTNTWQKFVSDGNARRIDREL